jgi:membrane-bound serine protease (ClpP class)
MTTWIWLALAWVLLFVEFYLPSGVIATLGGIFFLLALANGFMTFGVLGGLLFMLISVCGSACVIWLAMVLIQKSSLKNTFFLSANQEGFRGTEADSSLVGATGIAVSDLRPSGFVLIDKRRMPVISEGRYIEKGSEVSVIASQGGYLVVTLLKG